MVQKNTEAVMSLSTSRLAYTDCYTLLDAALDNPRGLRVEMRSIPAASYFRLRIHHARQIDRNDNAKTYSPDHPLHACSPYDALTLRIEPGPPIWLYLDRVRVELGRIEAIPEDHQIGQTSLAPHRPLLLEHKPNGAQLAPQIRRR